MRSMRSPLPRIAISGTCDATGAATVTNQIVSGAGYWSLIYCAVQVSSGAPAWAVQLGSTATSAPLVFGQGQQAMLGPFLLMPGEYASLTVKGADASAVVSGQALGWQSDDPEELLGSTPITTALATPISPLPVTGAVSIIGTATVALSQPAYTELVGASGALLGDPTAAVLLPDQVADTVATSGTVGATSSAVIASMKPAAGQTIAQVGALGTHVSGPASVSPAFGQATVAGHLLAAWVTASNNSADIATTAAGWSRVVTSFVGGAGTTDANIWIKPNCGNGETAPVFTVPGGQMTARLAEFSGVALAAPTDQTGSIVNSLTSPTMTPVNGGTDGQFGDLVLMAARWSLSQPAGSTFSATFNNGAATVDAGHFAQAGLAENLAYAIIPAAKATAPLVVQANKKLTYSATFRLAARPYALSNAFAGAGRKQYATIYHANTAAKLVKLRHCLVAIESASVAAIVMADLIRLTAAATPATGNPAITPTPANPGDAAAEATTLALPTTPGTEAALWATSEWNLGVTGAASVANPAPPLTLVDLVELGLGAEQDEESKLPAMRAATAEGWALTIDCNAASTIKGYVTIIFTEE